jgi:type II secretory pathway component GspD/PulD (secretin)
MLSAPAAYATDFAASNQRFDVSIRDQNVREVLDEVSIAVGVPILVSDAVRGRVSASFAQATAVDLLDGIADNRGLDWRYDGRRIHVTSRSEQLTRIVGLDGVRIADLSDALRSLGVYDKKFQMTAVDGEFAMLVAPPDYIAVVEVVLGALIERHAASKSAAEVARKEREALERRAAEQRLEFDRLARAAELERTRREYERLQRIQRENELRARRGPTLIRNGVWGG